MSDLSSSEIGLSPIKGLFEGLNAGLQQYRAVQAAQAAQGSKEDIAGTQAASRMGVAQTNAGSRETVAAGNQAERLSAADLRSQTQLKKIMVDAYVRNGGDMAKTETALAGLGFGAADRNDIQNRVYGPTMAALNKLYGNKPPANLTLEALESHVGPITGEDTSGGTQGGTWQPPQSQPPSATQEQQAAQTAPTATSGAPAAVAAQPNANPAMNTPVGQLTLGQFQAVGGNLPPGLAAVTPGVKGLITPGQPPEGGRWHANDVINDAINRAMGHPTVTQAFAQMQNQAGQMGGSVPPQTGPNVQPGTAGAALIPGAGAAAQATLAPQLGQGMTPPGATLQPGIQPTATAAVPPGGTAPGLAPGGVAPKFTMQQQQATDKHNLAQVQIPHIIALTNLSNANKDYTQSKNSLLVQTMPDQIAKIRLEPTNMQTEINYKNWLQTFGDANEKFKETMENRRQALAELNGTSERQLHEAMKGHMNNQDQVAWASLGQKAKQESLNSLGTMSKTLSDLQKENAAMDTQIKNTNMSIGNVSRLIKPGFDPTTLDPKDKPFYDTVTANDPNNPGHKVGETMVARLSESLKNLTQSKAANSLEAGRILDTQKSFYGSPQLPPGTSRMSWEGHNIDYNGGIQLKGSQIAAKAREAGVPESEIPRFTAVAMAESGGWTGQASAKVGQKGYDRGIMQFNTAAPPVNITDDEAYNPDAAIKAAADYIFRNGPNKPDYSPWSAFKNGQYKAHLGDYKDGPNNVALSVAAQRGAGRGGARPSGGGTTRSNPQKGNDFVDSAMSGPH